MSGQQEVDSYSLSAYSCSDCIGDRSKDVEELCDSKDSILETGAEEAMDHGLPSDNQGSREGRDGKPEDQRVSSFVEIYVPHSPSMSKDNEEEASLDDVKEDDSLFAIDDLDV